MLKRLVLWFIIFVLSVLTNKLGGIEQGKAFLVIDIGLIFVIPILIGILGKNKYEIPVMSLFIIIDMVIKITLALMVALLVKRLFDIDFLVVYQIIRLGQSLCFEA